MWMRTGTALLVAIAAGGCTPQPAAVQAAVSEKVYAMSPDTIKVASGLISGELTEMKVTEQVEAGSGKVTTPAKLTGKLVLKNVSRDQTLRLVGGKFHYLDVQGKPIKLEENRAEPTLRMSQSYGSADRLDPGQDATHSIDAEFPAEALADKKLKEVRLELTYIPAPFKAETMSFPVSVGSAQ